jgi:hypothetical protein
VCELGLGGITPLSSKGPLEYIVVTSYFRYLAVLGWQAGAEAPASRAGA